jgi:FAD/FMN-containing dehydrogenase
MDQKQRLAPSAIGSSGSTLSPRGLARCSNAPEPATLNPNDPREMEEAERLNERVVQRALSLDGTCTGEHGIGCGKIDFLVAEHGEAVSVMRAIKTAIDPDNIMNPGKILRI